MTEYAEQPPARRIRFDPTRVRDERLYARAYSHSRWVRRMKFVLPAVAIAAVAGFFLTMRVVTGTGEAVISNAGINVAKKSLEMKAPHISGFTGTKQSYELKALRALQDLDNPKVVRLEKIDGHFGIGKDQTAMLSDADGTLLVDQVYRFEEMEEAYNDIVRRLDLTEAPPLTRKNASSHADYRSYYTERERALVEELWRRDIERFSYTF